MRYVDGYVLPLPKKNLKKYQKMASLGGRIWIDNGALQYFECAGEDLQPKFGVPFPKQMRLKKGETVIFAFIVFKSRKHRDQVNVAVMKDERMNEFMGKNMPFDPKRMVYGGFKAIVEL